jgi:[protein-PII] uridylyltransferase
VTPGGGDRPPAVSRLRDELASLDRAYSQGHHGRWSSKRRTELVDAALRSLFQDAAGADGAGRVALVALGGYARSTLAPSSDIDLMLIHEGSDPDAVARLADALLYPLWDAGFDVGHAVRTPSEALEAARETLDGLTAQMDARHLAGQEALTRDLVTAVTAIASEDPLGFALRLREAAAARRQRYGSTAHLLEPDLKDGAGGLRDVTSLAWLERSIGSTLEVAGVIRPRERESLEGAEEFLMRVRAALHLETGRRTDRLVVDHQAGIARMMGFEDEPRLVAVDGLMRGVFEHARAVLYVTEAVFGRLLDDHPTAAATPGVASADFATLLAQLADSTEARVAPALELLDQLEAAAPTEAVDWDDQIRDSFLRILRCGEQGVGSLETLDRLGILPMLLPGWADVRCRPQRDPYHRFTVDAHLTTALTGMSSMLDADAGTDPIEREAVKHASDRDAMLLGALFHDIGKVGQGSHVEVGTGVARELLSRMGVPASTRELATFMVTEHLLLPDTATRRDLTDDDLILDVASRIGSTERLAALYLLAKADAEATGPAAWTPWRSTLVRELVGKIQRVFDRGDMGVELAEQLTDRIERIRDLLVGEPEPEVERFILRMPRGYFLSLEPAQIAGHFSTISPPVGMNEVRTASHAGSRPGVYDLLVVAVDRPGLLSWIAGALSLAGLSILSAQVFTTEDKVAVDIFEVEGAWEPEIGEERWRGFRSNLRGTIEGTVSIARRVDEKRKFYPAPPADVPVTVTVDNHASDFFTVIEIGAADRIGLLYDMTSAMAELKLDVHLAKVATYTARVVDAFYVRDQVGRKITEPAEIADLERVIRARLGAG